MGGRTGERALTLRLARSLIGLTTGVAVVVAVAGPLTWFFLRYDDQRVEAGAHAHTLAREVSEFSDESPGLWIYNRAKIAERVESLAGTRSDQVTRVLDARGRAVYASGDETAPCVWASVPLSSGGRVLGTVIVGLPAAPLLWRGLLLLGCFALLGAMAGGFLFFAPVISLRRAEDRLRRTITRLETERERRRIARELHDSTGQMLTAIRLNLEAAGEILVRSPASPEPLGRILRDTAALTDGTIAAIRDMVHALDAPLFHPGGLEEAVRQLTGQLGRSGCSMAVDAAGLDLGAVSHAAEICAFRLIQEAVTNAVRHAAPCGIRVRLRGGDGGLSIEVCDDGTGKVTLQEGHGIRGMRERVALLGGRISVETGPAPGVTVCAFLPGVIASKIREGEDDG